MLGTSSPPVLSMASRIARARALKADSALDAMCEAVSPNNWEDLPPYTPVVIVLSTEDVYVQCRPRRHGERVKDVGEHLG